MSGIFTINVSEARGTIAVPADIDRTVLVMGCSSAGSGLSDFYLSGQSAVAALGYGDGVDTVTQVIEQPQSSGASGTKIPCAMYTLPATTPGSYGTIDLSGVTGTAVPAVDAQSPLGTYQAAVRVIAGGTVGTSGITYQTSLDNGRHWSNTTALGVASTIAIANVACGFVLNPPSAALYSSLNALRTACLAHMLITSGSPAIHGGADNTNNTALSAIPAATTMATAIALFNGIKTYLAAHVIRTSGSVHGAADTTAQTAIAAVGTATYAQDVVTGLPALIAAYNAHRVLVSTVHGSADSTNTCAASTATHGTLAAGDTWTVWTVAPAPSSTDITDAATAIASGSFDCGLVFFAFDVDGTTLAPAVSAALDTLAAVGKKPVAAIQVRQRDWNGSETESNWLDSVSLDFASYTDSRVCKRASYGLITDAMTGNVYLRPDFAEFCAEVARVGIGVWPDSPSDTAAGMPSFSLTDSAGALVGHDEGPMGVVTGLSNPTIGNTFSCVQRLPISGIRDAVYNTVPWVGYDVGETIQTLMVRRIANSMERVAALAAVPSLGARLAYTSTGPTSGVLTPVSIKLLQSAIFAALSGTFSGVIDNASNADLNTGLVQVAPTVTVAPGRLLTVSITIAPQVGGYVQTINLTLAIQQ